LKDGVLINTAEWIIYIKKRITKIEGMITSTLNYVVAWEIERNELFKENEDLLIDKKRSLSEI
jgi:hypothetical protein